MANGRSNLRGALDLFDRFSPTLPRADSGEREAEGHKLIYMALLEVTAWHCRLDAARVVLARMQAALKLEACADALAVMSLAAGRSNDMAAARAYLVGPLTSDSDARGADA